MKNYPCDNGGNCPYGDGGGMYFCRDNCGLGVDEENIDDIKRELERELEIELERELEREPI